MNAFDVKEILIKMGYTIHSETMSHYHMRPLYRDSDNNLALEVDKSTGLWYDFVERFGGSLPQLIERTLALTPDKVKEFLKDESFAVAPKNNYELDEIKKFDKNLLFKLKKDHSYWQNRGISPKTVSTFEGGTTVNGRMKNRYVFPIFNERNDVVGFSGRSLVNYTSVPKWKHIGAKSSWCYPLKWNYNVLVRLKQVILLESIGDMLALWESGIYNTLVTFGVTISPAIISHLLRIDAKKILISFNNDEEKNKVGNDAANEGKQKLMKYFDAEQVSVAIPDHKDFGMMDKEQIELWKNKFQIQN